MNILKYKYKAHKLVNTIFYLLIFAIGFIMGSGIKDTEISEIMANILMIDNVSAVNLEKFEYTTDFGDYVNYSITFDYEQIGYRPSSSTFMNEELIYNIFNEIVELSSLDISFNDYSNVFVNRIGSTNTFTFYFSPNEYTGSYSRLYTETINFLTITYEPNYNEVRVRFYVPEDDGNIINYLLITGSLNSSVYASTQQNLSGLDYYLDFSDYLIESVELESQVNTWNGYGYDYYTNQIGILDMREDTYIVSSHTCPNDGEFVSGYLGDTNDICFWSYNNDLSDYLVFYFNGRNYDSENVEWSNIKFLKDNTYVLSFTLYGLVDSETLSSIQFSLEGELTQEIFSSNFTKNLRESMDEKTYITFAITPTEDIEMDHFFLKFNSNGSYAQTVGANRLWSYKDYTGRIDEIELEQTDKSLMVNNELKDLINNPLGNSESVTDFWHEFNHKDFGLTQIITAPINTIKKISNGTCTPINIEILGKTIELPCGDDIFWNREDVSDFKIFWNMFWGGLLCYGIGRLIVKDVQKATNPNNDKLEVIDL